MDYAHLFHADGTVKGIGYADASTTRGAIISVKKKVPGRTLATGFIIDGTDFGSVYDQAVDVLADFLGMDEKDPMRARMKDTKKVFLESKGLVIEPVVIRYDQVMRK